jgi:hypothetical protein
VNIGEPTQNLGVLGASDRYEGYAAERAALLNFVKVNNIQNVVFVTADIHGTLVNNLTYQTSPGGPQIQSGAWEISTGSGGYDAPFGPTVAGLAAQLGGFGFTQDPAHSINDVRFAASIRTHDANQLPWHLKVCRIDEGLKAR